MDCILMAVQQSTQAALFRVALRICVVFIVHQRVHSAHVGSSFKQGSTKQVVGILEEVVISKPCIFLALCGQSSDFINKSKINKCAAVTE